jgi:hypothetical protein
MGLFWWKQVAGGHKASLYMENPHSFHSYKRTLTPRRMLQLLGTDCGRNIIHPNIWVNATMVDYKEKRLKCDNRVRNDTKILLKKGNRHM